MGEKKRKDWRKKICSSSNFWHSVVHFKSSKPEIILTKKSVPQMKAPRGLGLIELCLQALNMITYTVGAKSRLEIFQ